MKEVRDIKIDLLMGNQNPVIDLFREITSGIEIINCHVYNEEGLEFIYHKDGQWIFYQDCKNEKFWCNFTTYWSFFESKLGLEYLEIQSITKYLVEEALKREVVTPVKNKLNFRSKVEEALKREVVTPKIRIGNKLYLVEEALKREVVTPNKKLLLYRSLVEEALKREVVTPPKLKNIKQSAVEEALKREVSTDKNDAEIK